MITNILSVGTSVPDVSFTQAEAARALKIGEGKPRRFFDHPHIKKRHLLFEGDLKNESAISEESPTDLRKKFLTHSLPLIAQAMLKALAVSGHKLQDISYLGCVTSTAFLVPGLSALVVEYLKINHHIQRIDIVGMGCNAGLNGLNAATNWSRANPKKLAMLVCCELSSCIYSIDEDENTALVNSLFGDGVAAIVLKTSDQNTSNAKIISFESFMIPQSLDCLRFDLLEKRNRYNFFIDKRTPEYLAASVERPLKELLTPHNLTTDDIQHWILHTGGEAILSAIEKQLHLSEGKLKHTRSVLHDFGNISSGSFLFSYERLLMEQAPRGFGVMMTMGPGLTIECALISWENK
jgi:polyketide synthase Type III